VTTTKRTSPLEGDHALDAFQHECVALFVNAAASLSIPRSIGEIYGLLFSTEEPLSLDDLTARLHMSRGAAHEGLRWLKGIGAAKSVYIPRVRKEHFVAETSLRRLAAGYLHDRIEPHLVKGQDRLRQLREAAGENAENGAFQRNRVTQITNWYKFLQRALPAVKALAGKY
jgi:HTH-type transcriptional regulator, glycine betaine synthesis regulator